MAYKTLHAQLQITSMKYINQISSHEKCVKNINQKSHIRFKMFHFNKNNTTDKRRLKPMLTPFKTPVTHVVDSNPECQRGIFYSTLLYKIYTVKFDRRFFVRDFDCLLLVSEIYEAFYKLKM